MTTFTQHLEDYLRLRRALGFKLDEHARLLRKCAMHLEAIGAELVTIEVALTWAVAPIVPAGSVCASDAAAGRARVRALDPRTEIPPTRLIRRPRHRRVPYIYTDGEIRLVDCAERQRYERVGPRQRVGSEQRRPEGEHDRRSDQERASNRVIARPHDQVVADAQRLRVPGDRGLNPGDDQSRVQQSQPDQDRPRGGDDTAGQAIAGPGPGPGQVNHGEDEQPDSIAPVTCIQAAVSRRVVISDTVDQAPLSRAGPDGRTSGHIALNRERSGRA